MPKRISIQPHLSIEEVEAHYRHAKDPVQRTHYQIIWLLAQGKPTQEVAGVTGYSRSWIYELVWGYNRTNPETLGDHRHQNPGGSEPLLDDVQQAYLWQALQSPPVDGGQWNGRSCGRLAGSIDWSSSRSPTWVGVSQANALTPTSASSRAQRS